MEKDKSDSLGCLEILLMVVFFLWHSIFYYIVYSFIDNRIYYLFI